MDMKWNEMKWTWTWNSNLKMEIKVHLKIEKNSLLEEWKLTNGECKKKSFVRLREQTGSQKTVIENKFACFWVTLQNWRICKNWSKNKIVGVNFSQIFLSIRNRTDSSLRPWLNYKICKQSFLEACLRIIFTYISRKYLHFWFLNLIIGID